AIAGSGIGLQVGNLILLQMVEQRADVMHGRDTGPF
ncbi:hypothetical protein Pgy4_41102, partial [Pseudomonas savastanoi pv. glycinea str. race 4]